MEKGFEIFCKMVVAFLNEKYVVDGKKFYARGKEDQKYIYRSQTNNMIIILRKDREATINQDLETRLYFELADMLKFCDFHIVKAAL